ncbi:hypothetical protein RD792_014722 [Penstemon davidsonii]|uniref:Aminotransferase-like plant mobile domain-containing protein n=1 Tax=Penstemon davidsonii TaxID=160366 RepID=A0ABR0CRX1_9LAMI|nr:hypothetical protein RD792_014722 [Penstemon davidsonii]
MEDPFGGGRNDLGGRKERLVVYLKEMGEGSGSGDSNPCTLKMNVNHHIIHPGPIDPSVLTLQGEHRSMDIWNGDESTVITCRRGDAPIRDLGKVDARVLPYVINAGFYGVYRIGFIKHDWPLITALVERWREETHTFHLPTGEATVTLQDVGVLLGLPIDGNAVTSSDTECRTKEQWQALCFELLGAIPPSNQIVGVHLKIKWLMDTYKKPLPEDATDEMIHHRARALILSFIGGVVVPNLSGNKVNMKYLLLLRDVYTIGNYSWGSAALSYLYHELCRATRPMISQIGGCLTLLQIWAWERIKCLRPNINNVLQNVDGIPEPMGYRWRGTKLLEHVPTHVLRVYRDQLDLLKDDQFLWQPYPQIDGLPLSCVQGIEIWRSRIPLICFERVEWHFPDRVLRQFGMLQGIPPSCDTSRDLHIVTCKGRTNVSWVDMHRQYINVWEEQRHQLVVEGELGVEHMSYNHEYMIWYRSITRLFIANPYSMVNQRDEGDEIHEIDDTGYRGVGCGFEGLIQQVQRINLLIEEYLPNHLQDDDIQPLLRARQITIDALTVVGEQERLTGQAPPSPTYVVPPPRRQQPQPRRRRRVSSRGPAPPSVADPPPATASPSAPPSVAGPPPATASPSAPSSSRASPPRNREFNPPPWLIPIEYSTPNQVECVTQVDMTSRSQVDMTSTSQVDMTSTSQVDMTSRRSISIVFNRRKIGRERRPPDRYTPN